MTRWGFSTFLVAFVLVVISLSLEFLPRPDVGPIHAQRIRPPTAIPSATVSRNEILPGPIPPCYIVTPVGTSRPPRVGD